MLYVYNDKTFYRRNPVNVYEEIGTVCRGEWSSFFGSGPCFRHSALGVGTYLNSSYIKSSTIKAH